MKIYTKTGDKGTTALYGGTRVAKHHIRIECYGTVDELNSYLGLIKDQNISLELKKHIVTIQNDLFTLGAMLATPQEKEKLKNGNKRLNIDKINLNNVTFLEQQIDEMNSTLPAMTHFILPGGHQTVSFCHIARCVCRRAERLTVALHETEPLNDVILQYLNRLSDFLFVMARYLSFVLKIEEDKWIPQKL